jgi:hypothetical protein
MYNARSDMEPYDGQKSLREDFRSSHCIHVSCEIYHGSPSTSAIMASSLADVGDLHLQFDTRRRRCNGQNIPRKVIKTSLCI